MLLTMRAKAQAVDACLANISVMSAEIAPQVRLSE
jgi:hypothetical protein